MPKASRLIESFIPDHYDLSIDINRIGRTFHGTVTLHGILQNDADALSLHAKDLEIESVLVDGKLASITTGENDEIHIAQDNLAPGAHTIVAGYRGTITDAMHGIYPCYYEHAGVRKEILATQFESHHAREVFPCIDEPEAKATFDLTLTTDEDITVLGNMPVAYQDSDGNKLVTKFETSPRMSTYLLAFVAGELQKKSATTKDGVEVNVWASPAQTPDSLNFALDTATRAIDFYDDYFGVPYPLSKADHVALPDFTVGAMENWGLITYRETALLADPAIASIATRQRVALVVCHELAHQWFGNLVTMKWWNDLWLNESFATMMEYIALDALFPEWNSWMDFSSKESIAALRRDSLDGVQAVQVEVNHPDEIGTLFDSAIVYAKGARLLRMLQQYIGHDDFQAGLKVYFQDHAYKNTIADDLWRALSDASGKNMGEFMQTWISQSGYPVVHIKKSDDTIHLSQEQFFVGPRTPSAKQWPIPLNSTSPNIPPLLDQKELVITDAIDLPVRLNDTDTAHFLTHYDEQLLQSIVESLRSGLLAPIDRLQLLNEATLLARGGVLPSASLITLITAYTDETNESVWDIIALAIAELQKFVEDDSNVEAKLRTLSGNIARAHYQRLGWEKQPSEPEADTKLRATIIALMLYSDDTDAIATARELYDTTSLAELPAELRSLILASVAKHGDANVVDELMAQHNDTQSSELRQDISAGVCSTQHPEKIAELLDGLKNSKVVRPQDISRWFAQLCRNRASRDLTWQWLRENWSWISDAFQGDKSYDNFPRISAMFLSTQNHLDEYQAFFGPKQNIPALSRVISLGIAEIQGRVELIERDRAAVSQALLQK